MDLERGGELRDPAGTAGRASQVVTPITSMAGDTTRLTKLQAFDACCSILRHGSLSRLLWDVCSVRQPEMPRCRLPAVALSLAWTDAERGSSPEGMPSSSPNTLKLSPYCIDCACHRARESVQIVLRKQQEDKMHRTS